MIEDEDGVVAEPPAEPPAERPARAARRSPGPATRRPRRPGSGRRPSTAKIYVLQIKLKPRERIAVDAAAKREVLPRATWARMIILRHAGFGDKTKHPRKAKRVTRRS